MVDVKSKRLVLRRSVDASERDFAASTEWQDYLRATVRSDRRHGPLLINVRDDVEDYSFKGGRRKDGRIYATVTIPSAWLDKPTAYENADVYRAVKARLFADLAEAADLPTPPPLPRKLPPREEKMAPGAGYAWLSERKRFKAPKQAVREWFFADEAWQEYLPRTQGDLYSFVYLIEDVDELKCTYGRKRNGEVSVGVHVPAELLINNADPELTLAQVAREAYLWGAEKFGWPEPPPVPKRPPGHEKPKRPINTDVGPLRRPSQRH
ncbi:MAG: hypothetical protein FWE71_14765 [Nocardioidaceae bacterium]|nr:hypothetical protein [Nocardioidaceae bacterium]MCL2612430.1 hypothetical protein [Nocardioidaceae bacterium]